MTESQALSTETSGENERVILIQHIAKRIHHSLELPEILAAVALEVRSYLKIDRVKIYRFDGDGSGEVIAESLAPNRLPSLQGLRFPADDIPAIARKNFLKAKVRSIVDVDRGSIVWSPGTVSDIFDAEIEGLRQVDPCHLEYLKTMGVRSSVVLPLQISKNLLETDAPERLWGLLIVHHSEVRTPNDSELQILQWIADQTSSAISQAELLRQARHQTQQQATINRVSSFLHSLQTIQLQHALSETVIALQGSGGRLYLAAAFKGSDNADIYTCGNADKISDRSFGHTIEEHPSWQQLLAEGMLAHPTPSSSVDRQIVPIAISNLYKVPLLRVLSPAFGSTRIRGLLIFPLYYRQQLLGSLTICRDEIETETLWAGYFDPNEKQTLPRQSFEVWREYKRGQALDWTQEEVELGTALAGQFAIAIQQHQLYRQINDLNGSLERVVRERTAQLQQSLNFSRVLRQISERIRSSLDLDATLQAVVREVGNLLDADRMVIYKFSPNYELEAIVEEVKGKWRSVLGVDSPPQRFSDRDIAEFLNGHVQASNEVSSDRYLTPIHRHFLQNIQVQATLIVPIRIGEKLWGLLVANECKAPRIWQDAEIKLLQQLADRVAVAINQAELYRESNIAATLATKRAFELERIAEQQRTLFRVITKIRESLELNAIFQTATTEVRQLLHADRAAIFRFAPDSNYTEGEFIAEDTKVGLDLLVGQKVCDRCFGEDFRHDYERGRMHLVSNLAESNLSDCHREFLQKFQIRAHLVVPLSKGEQLWGLLCVHQCQRIRTWHPSEVDFVQQIATHLSVALQQGFLLAQTQKQTEELARALSDLQKTQTQLIQTEKMSSLGQLVAGVAHEINNPVNFIYGNLTYLEEYAESLLDLLQFYRSLYARSTPELVEREEELEIDFLLEDLPKILASLKMGAERIRQLVLSLRNFSRLDEAERKPVDIHEGIDSTLLILQHRLKAKENKLPIEIVKKYGDLPQIECYAGQLNQVFMNILSNAIDAIEERRVAGKIVIRTAVALGDSTQDSRAVIKISDNGQGMPLAVINSIFDPFFTTKPLGKGTGLGLAISYQIIVEKHRGNLRCKSVPGEGTTFEIEIPMQNDGEEGTRES
ncbi:GAF domain-containing protein [Oscillatoria sp. FACHB-1406]|uniref:GAF domain-containing sensor histidine kinase n=1 Tax=Oscillatoria sp. FACHB-1406 TaxID=2692846 RepID=UPI0016848628|nr:GAF domain-containing protein [Oscillatoria sp. FACHB-1406]MBD2579270.1 GAF domain-containing protein [Oscillatoria sp. FACHB-1406]